MEASSSQKISSQINAVFRASRMFLSVLGVILTVLPASAERYLVVMKNQQVFSQMHSQLMLQPTMNLSAIRIESDGSTHSMISSDTPEIQIEDSLENLQTLVVNTQDQQTIEALKSSPDVMILEKEVFHPAPRPVGSYALTQPWDYDLNYAVPRMKLQSSGGSKTPWGILAVRAPQAWEASHYGKGARVMVLDTGIDHDHPALKANIEKEKDFVGDDNKPYPVADHVGHGTHVSGTIAAVMGADGFSGVAPQAKILMGRVCSENGCSNISVAQGINWGITQKVDVISMSLGGSVATAAEKKAVERADAAGISIVAASGNDGTPQVGFPAAFPTVVAVGAIDSSKKKAGFSQWGPELAVVAPGVDVISSVPMGMGRATKVTVNLSGKETEANSTALAGSPEVLTPLAADIMAAGLGKPEDFKSGSMAGKIALVRRGEIPFAEKLKNAMAANAIGVIVYNNETGLAHGAVTQDGSTVAIPIVMIEQSVGEGLLQALNRGGQVSASITTTPTDYESFQGTSMATPHVSGVVALVKAANKKLTPAQVKSLLKETAEPLAPNDQNQMGSGLVNAEKAVARASQH